MASEFRKQTAWAQLVNKLGDCAQLTSDVERKLWLVFERSRRQRALSAVGSSVQEAANLRSIL